MTAKIVSVNVEGDKHLETVAAFLKQENATVVCLMEAREEDMVMVVGKDYPYSEFAPNDILPSGKRTGVMVLSKTPIELVDKYYCGEEAKAYLNKPGIGTHAPILLLVETRGIKIGVVHFSWTPDGHENERQEKHLEKLLKYLGQQGEMILCGDFNIPRGYKLYYEVNKYYRDNIPSEITTTIDPELHRANKEERGKLALVVDYVWSCLPAGRLQPKYLVRNVRVVAGVSDHCGIVAEVDRI